MMFDPTEIVDDLTGVAKKAMDNQQTERLKLDNTSPFILPHLIRPIMAIVVLFLQVLLFVAVFLGVEVPEDLIYEVGALNMAAIGFYFNSRRNEKINAKKTEAAIYIEKMRAKSEIRRDRKEARKAK